jgi:hypothetical protein
VYWGCERQVRINGHFIPNPVFGIAREAPPYTPEFPVAFCRGPQMLLTWGRSHREMHFSVGRDGMVLGRLYIEWGDGRYD